MLGSTETKTMETNVAVGRPQPGEYAPYYDRYISLVQETDVIGVLEQQVAVTVAALAVLPESAGDFRYAPGKWSVKEVLGHINDTERIFAYRALRIARNDQTPLAGFEQDDYVRWGSFVARRLDDLVEEFAAIRETTLALLRGLDEAAWSRRGIASQNEVTVRALAYMIAGHELHHRRILQEKYFPSQQSIA
jgi:uncharacterized damage-inducible protein DinB